MSKADDTRNREDGQGQNRMHNDDLSQREQIERLVAPHFRVSRSEPPFLSYFSIDITLNR